MPSRFVRDGRIWKQCSKCGEDKPHDEEHYYRSGRNRDKTPRFYTQCKVCCQTQAKEDFQTRSDVAKARQKRRLRAAQRAKTRLAQEWPERYQALYEEELFREGPLPTEETV